MPTKIQTISILFIISFLSVDLRAQVLDPDGDRQPIPYTNLREADVMWSKRVWRIIDMRKKQNQVFYFPEEPAQGRMNLFDHLLEGILKNGNITAYDAGSAVNPDDGFTRALTVEEVMQKLVTETIVPDYDEFGDEIGTTPVTDTLRSTSVKFYEIKEEWFFEKQKSQLEVRIIGIKPIIEIEGPDGNPTLQDLFWIYFPEARYAFAKAEVFNRHNDAERRTYEDVFWKRQFESDIIKVSNVYDRTIADYKTGIDALLEAEKLEEEIFNFEHDLWRY